MWPPFGVIPGPPVNRQKRQVNHIDGLLTYQPSGFYRVATIQSAISIAQLVLHLEPSCAARDRNWSDF